MKNDGATGRMPARYKAIFMLRCVPTFTGHGGFYESPHLLTQHFAEKWW